MLLRDRYLAALAGALLAAIVAAPAAMAAEDGKKLFLKKTCVACHGKDGRKAIIGYPNLAGQNEKYLLQQMKDIASGARLGSPDQTGNPRTAGMKAVMHLVDDAQMAAIAKWLSKQAPAEPKPPKEPIDSARLDEGAKLYKKGGCISCHGPEGKKPTAGRPFIAGQKTEYLVAQMKDLRDGHRTNGQAKTMLNFIKKLDDEQIGIVADYLSQVKR